LRGLVEDPIDLGEQGWQVIMGQVDRQQREAVMRLCRLDICVLARDIVVLGEAVDTDHLVAVGQQ